MIHTAITIGPILETMQLARSSKAIWSASYLFSYVMKEFYSIIEEKLGRDTILSPRTNDLNEIVQAGIFPDRLMIEGKLDDFETIKHRIIDELAQIIARDINEDNAAIKKYLNNYLIIQKVEKDFSEGDKIVKKLNQLLDTTELFRKSNQYLNQNYLERFFELKDKGYNSFIKKEYGDKPIAPINQIATQGLDLNYRVIENDNNDFYQHVETHYGDSFRKSHKYIAIVQADGDNFGKFISNLTDKKSIQLVSDNLFKFSTEAIKVIKGSSGVPIYIGGDDLLFMSPIVMTDGTIFNVVDELDNLFQRIVLENPDIKPLFIGIDAKPSMSYAINISYYKYPLKQALSSVGDLLFEKAKQGNKNAIALRVTKHSGQVFETVYDKNNTIYIKVKELFDHIDVNENFISNFMYKLDPLHEMLLHIGMIPEAETRNQRFESFFENYFDEDSHKKSLENGFLSKVKELLQEIYTAHPLNNDIVDNVKQHKFNITQLYASLRFYQFINAKPE